MVTVRPIESGEEEVAARIESEALSTAWSVSQISNRDAHTIYLVALVDGEVCGIASLNLIFDDCEILNIATDPKHRRRGIADALMRSIIDTASEKSVSALTLEVAESNSGAISLYEKHGFSRIGIRKGFYNGETAIVMQRNM